MLDGHWFESPKMTYLTFISLICLQVRVPRKGFVFPWQIHNEEERKKAYNNEPGKEEYTIGKEKVLET